MASDKKVEASTLDALVKCMWVREWEINLIKIQGLIHLGEVSDVLMVWSMLQ